MRLGKKERDFIYYLLLTLFGYIMLYPLLWLLGSSFKEHSEIFANITSLIPKEFTWNNYIEGWKGFGGISFTIFFKNSFIVAILETLGVIFSSTIIAYGFARISFPGRNFWFYCMLTTMMLPFQVTMIPRYILFLNFGWVNSFKPLVIPAYFGAPFYIFMIRQFISGIPLELDESAFIDGAGRLRIFWNIILPNIKPAIITATIFTFYGAWNDFMGPLLYLNRPELFTVSLALRAFSDPSAVTNWGAVFAMSVLSLVPILVIFVLLQKYIVRGIVTTGIRG